MSIDDVVGTTDDDTRKATRYSFDRHTADYRVNFQRITDEMLADHRLAWSDTYEGHWVAAGNREVFEIARAAEYVSNEHDVDGTRRGYSGITIPKPARAQKARGGFLEMDPPEQRHYRNAVNPYLSPAAVARWIPVIDEIVRASLDEKIESGRLDFVDDLANVVPAVLTLAMLGVPMNRWEKYVEPVHAGIYTPPTSPDIARVGQMYQVLVADLVTEMHVIKAAPRPGLINAVHTLTIDGEPVPEIDKIGTLMLLIGGGFDTTTALTAHALEYLGLNPDERERLSRERDTLLDSATEEFLRFYTPAPGDARTISADVELAGQQFKEGERVWLSWAMANRDPAVFEEPHEIKLDRKGNRHNAFGLGIHRCIGSNVARTVFKRMLLAVLDRIPDYVVDPEGTVHYETIGVIQGMQHLPVTFTPGPRLGPGIAETIEQLQKIVDEQELAAPIARKRDQVTAES